MFVVRAGQCTALVPLTAVLREIHDALSRDVEEAIAARKASGAPLIGEATGVAIGPLPAFEPIEGAKDVSISVRAVPLDDVSTLSMIIGERVPDGDVAARVAHERRTMTAMREFIRGALGSLVGLVDDDKKPVPIGDGKRKLTDEEISTLEGAGGQFFFALFRACRHFQGLTSDEKKAFGAQAPST